MKIYGPESNCKTIEQAKAAMEALDVQLKGTEMENLIAFNHTYWIITRNVYDKLDTGYFEKDPLMRKIDVNFANYYFSALRSYCLNKPCPPAWKILFDLCKDGSQYQFIYMALGVNAHVNNDLPQTLRDVMQGDEFDADYIKVNTVIKNSLSEVIHALPESRKKYKLAADYLLPSYKNILYLLIKNWRAHSWKIYRQLIHKEITITEIERSAQDYASKLAAIKNVADIPKIVTFIQ